MSIQWLRTIRLLVTGFTMGLADLIPGVSGGTIAFLSGIYEELLYSIQQVTGPAAKLAVQLKIMPALRIIPFKFLVPLVVGIFAALFSLAPVVTYLLATYPHFVWSFFIGLVLASTVIVLKRIVKWTPRDIVAFAVATIATYLLMGATPAETPQTLLMFFISGAIAICAMILPGISGSFILVLLGKYQHVLQAVNDRNVVVLAVFIVGAIVGLALFARILNWLFTHHHDISVAILAGFMLGSIRKIWPWKEVVTTRIDSDGHIVPLIEQNILPEQFDSTVVISLVLAVIAYALIVYLDRLRLVKERTADISDPKFQQEHAESLRREQ